MISTWIPLLDLYYHSGSHDLHFHALLCWSKDLNSGCNCYYLKVYCFIFSSSGGLYSGGSAQMIEKSLNIHGDEILYVGDHIYTDVSQSKVHLRWRTALICRELEEEVSFLWCSFSMQHVVRGEEKKKAREKGKPCYWFFTLLKVASKKSIGTINEIKVHVVLKQKLERMTLVFY